MEPQDERSRTLEPNHRVASGQVPNADHSEQHTVRRNNRRRSHTISDEARKQVSERHRPAKRCVVHAHDAAAQLLFRL